MEAQVYPTAPTGMQQQPMGGIVPPSPRSFAGGEHVESPGQATAGGEHVESPGKAKGPLGKMKKKARKLKEKLMKVTGSHSHDHDEHKVDHGDRAYPSHPNEYENADVDDDDEEEDLIDLGDEQPKEEQARLLGAMDKSGDGSEVEVHGGVPASALAATPGSYIDNVSAGPYMSGGPQYNTPISPYKNVGPPNTVQAAPTEYHYPPATDDQMFQGLRDATREQPEPTHLGGMHYPSSNTVLNDVPYTPYNPMPSTDTSHNNVLNDVPYTPYKTMPSTDTLLEQLKPSPSPYTSYDNAPTKLSSAYDVPLTSFDTAPTQRSSPHDLPYTSYTKGPQDSCIEGGFLGLPTTDVKRSDRPSYPSTIDMFSQREPASPEGPTSFGANVAYPDDIVKPNPDFGLSSSPTHNKIAVINEDVPSGLGASAEDFGSQQDLLDKSVPENAPMTFDARDESVDRSVPDAVAVSALTSPADVVPTSGYAMSGGPKLDINKQEDERGIPFTTASGAGSFGKNEGSGELSGRSNDTEPSLPEYASNRDESLGRGIGNGEQVEEEMGPRGSTNLRGKTSIGDGTSNYRKDDDIDSYPKEPARSDQNSWGNWSANKLNNAKDAVTSTLMGSEERIGDEQPSVDTTYGKNEIEKPLVTALDDDATSDLRKGNEIDSFLAEPASSDQNSWGKWSGEKLNNAKVAVTSTLMGSEERGADEQPSVDTTYGKDASNDDATVQSPFGQNDAADDARGQSPLSKVASNDREQSVEPASSHQESWGKWSADKLNNAKDAVTSTVIGSEKSTAVGEPAMDTISYGKDESEKPLVSAIEDDETRPASVDQESWTKWSANKLNNAKDVVSSSLTSVTPASTQASDGDVVMGGVSNVETPKEQENAKVGPETHDDLYGEGIRDADARPKSVYDSADIGSKVGAAAAPTVGALSSVGADEGKRLYDHEDINDNLGRNARTNSIEDGEYYDPNNANNSHFQEGFSLGTGEDEEGNLNGALASSAAVAGSAIGKLQGLTEVVATKLGLTGNSNTQLATSEAHESGANASAAYMAEDAASPQVHESQKPASTGILQGFQNTVASALGYGGPLSPKSRENEIGEQRAIPLLDEPTNVEHSQQQAGGAHVSPAYMVEDVSRQQGHESEKPSPTGILQGLQNTVASALGYAGPLSPKPAREEEVREQRSPSLEDKPMNVEHSQQQVGGGAFKGLKDVLAAKIGYGAPAEEELQPKDQTIYDERGEHANAVKAKASEEGDRNIPASQQQGFKNVLASKLGYGVPSQKPAGDDTMEVMQAPLVSSAVEEEMGSDGNQPSSYTKMLYDTAAAAKQYLSPRGDGNADRVEH